MSAATSTSGLLRHCSASISKFYCSNFSEEEAVIGVESSGIMWAAMVGQDMALPFGYVLKVPKEYGMQQLIEGLFQWVVKSL